MGADRSTEKKEVPVLSANDYKISEFAGFIQDAELDGSDLEKLREVRSLIDKKLKQQPEGQCQTNKNTPFQGSS